MPDLDLLRYPIGKFVPRDAYNNADIEDSIHRITALPEKLHQAISGLSSLQLDTPYREGGWTVRQVVHHVADSHLNSYIRFKWALTENNPIIKAYDEKTWAETGENTADPQVSLNLLKSLHTKWALLLNTLTPADFQKTFIHPESKKELSLARVAALYAWHGEHHTAHITSLRKRMNWV